MDSTPILAAAAQHVVTAQSLDQNPGEDPVIALSMALGVSLEYETGLKLLVDAALALGPASPLDTTSAIDLVEAKIELLSEYKLEYPTDYDPADREAMKAEIIRLEALRQHLSV